VVSGEGWWEKKYSKKRILGARELERSGKFHFLESERKTNQE